MSYRGGRGSDPRGSRDSGQGYRGGRGRGRDDDYGSRGSRDSSSRGYDDDSRSRGYRGESRGRRGDSSRGGRGEYSGRGGRGSGPGDSGAAPEKLSDETMFQTMRTSDPYPTNNSVVPECGELYGSYGTPFSLSSNFFEVCSLPNRDIFQYVVTFEPQIESIGMKYALLKSHPKFERVDMVFDGNVLYLPVRIDEVSTSVTSNKSEEFQMTVKYTATVSPGSPSSLVIYNKIIRKVMGMLALKQIKRKHFDPKGAINVENCDLEVWPGIAGTFNFINNLPFYSVDVSHHVLRRENAYEFILKETSHGDSRSQEEVEKKLVGQVVMTRYNNRNYRVDSVDWEKNPMSKFKLSTGEEISYMDYYLKNYKITIKDKKQPLLVSRLKQRKINDKVKKEGKTEESEHIVHLIPELSFLTGITDDLRSNFSTMRELSKYTRLSPTGRCNGIHGFLDRVSKCPSAVEYMQSWGLKFSDQLATFPARRFPPEKIKFSGNESFVYNEKDADWNNAFRNVHLMVPCRLDRWFVVCSERDSRTTGDFVELLKTTANAIGFKIADPYFQELRNVNASEVARFIKDTRLRDYDLGLFILPPNRKEIYDAIKSLCCVDYPICTQVVLTKTLSRQNALRSVATKVVIQMSVKLGGEPWSVEIPTKQKMVIGIDVCHDTGRSASRNSWLGFVASLNNTFTRYYSRATRQPSNQEIVNTLTENMKFCLLQYYEINKCLPNGIYVYRDGVGDGQVDFVKTGELKSIISCISQLYNEMNVTTPPQIAYIIVRKRINTKLFSYSGGQQADNPIPGSIADRVITKSDYPNFYLVSQSVREGTVNPTHYIIIHNSTSLKTDIIQRLSYKICHLYFNWMGTVRVPAPCQYAHKLCFLVSQSVKKEPSQELSNYLYYL